MKNLIIAVVVIVVLGGGYWWYQASQPAAMMEKDVMGKDEAAMEDTNTVMMEKGSYEAYAPEKLVLAETGDVVLFFRASWCPTCRALDADIRAHLDNIPDGVTILDTDYDTSTALKQKYGVTYQHTLVQVDSAGNLIAKWTQSPTLASLLTNIK
jgi:thiol-disulfide isomerase/thioredoxin